MTFLFWTCWTFDLLATLFLLWAVGFRSGFGASTGLQQALLVLLVIVLVSGLILRFNVRSSWWSLSAVALPILSLLVSWIVSKYFLSN